MKITLIVPIYNSANYLRKCLSSLIEQTYQTLELILVNDGSTDSSASIIEDYKSKDSRIVVIHKQNGGIGSAYKAAFEVMKGEYVLFVDSDDWLELNAVENLLKLAVENDADMVSFGAKAINSGGGEVTLTSLKNIDLVNTTNESILKTHFEVLKHPTLARLYKRELFNGIVVFEQNIGIDEMLTPQLLAKCNRAVYTSDVYYNLLLRQDSVSSIEFSDRRILQTMAVYQFLINFMNQNIKNYSEIIYLKYFNVLIGMYQYALNNKHVIDLNIAKKLSDEIRIQFALIKHLPSYRHKSFKSRFLVWLSVSYPIIYKILAMFRNHIKKT